MWYIIVVPNYPTLYTYTFLSHLICTAVARAVLNRCLHVDRSVPPDHPEFAINIKCEFLEDFSYPKHGLIAELSEIQSELQSGLSNISSRISKSLTDLTAPAEDTPRDKQAEENGVSKTPSKYWATDWGPPKFRKSNHPLAIMVRYFIAVAFIL